MKLLLDLGNTRLKWAMVSADAWIERGAVAWDEDVAATLAQAWKGLAQPQRVLGASVARRVAKRIPGCSVALDVL